MKNMMKMMALVLCLLFACPAALAQDAGYVIGQPTEMAFADAFAAGKLVSAEVALDMEIDTQMMGIAQEEAAIFNAVLEALAQTKLRGGFGVTEEGVRIALGAQMADAAGANPVGVSALADVTLDGVSVESDLIPGKRVSIGWETILSLCGLSEADIEMIMSVKDMDPAMIEQAITELMVQIMPMLEQAAALAAPYMDTVADFVLSLPIEIKENLNEEGYPPTATEINITITQKDLGTLLGLLCDQLEADTQVLPFVKALLEEADAGMTEQELLAQVRAAAQGLTDTTVPVTLYLGMDESGMPLYFELLIIDETSGMYAYGGLSLYQDAEGVWKFELLGGLYDAQDVPVVSMGVVADVAYDALDPNIGALSGELGVYVGEAPMMEMVLTAESVKAEGELPAYDSKAAVNVVINDGETNVQAVASAECHQAMTAAGGELVKLTTTSDAYSGDVAVSQTQTLEQMIEPTEGYGVTGYMKVSESMPAVGLKKIDMTVDYTSEDIDMAASQALEQIAIETATEDQMNALLMDVMNVAMGEKLPAVMNVLPPALLEMLAASLGE